MILSKGLITLSVRPFVITLSVRPFAHAIIFPMLSIARNGRVGYLGRKGARDSVLKLRGVIFWEGSVFLEF